MGRCARGPEPVAPGASILGINGLDAPSTFNEKPTDSAESGAKSGAPRARDGRGPSVGPSMRLNW